ncbi:hypothetical protein J6TS7_07230 [Paenibacillus dendritiformis]|nr:hypothetical protein J6TS7_07230 [Paenibacillus dendritiformis]
MKKRSLCIVMLAIALAVTGCTVNTKSNTEGQNNPAADGDSKPAAEGAVEIELLEMSSGQDDINIIRDQLTKNGFNVKLNLQPDYGSFKAQEEAGNFDISLSGWTTVTGNPDYAVRSLFKSGGDYSILSDPTS